MEATEVADAEVTAADLETALLVLRVHDDLARFWQSTARLIEALIASPSIDECERQVEAAA